MISNPCTIYYPKLSLEYVSTRTYLLYDPQAAGCFVALLDMAERVKFSLPQMLNSILFIK